MRDLFSDLQETSSRYLLPWTSAVDNLTSTPAARVRFKPRCGYLATPHGVAVRTKNDKGLSGSPAARLGKEIIHSVTTAVIMADENFPEVRGGGSLILAWQIRHKRVLVVGGGEVRPMPQLQFHCCN